MPEMHLKQPGFNYSPCGPFTKNKERIQKFNETEDISYIYKNELAKNPKYDGYQRGLASMVFKLFDKKSTGSSIANEPNYQLENELHKPIIRKLRKKSLFYI